MYVYFDLQSLFPGWELRTALILRDMGHRVMTIPIHRRPLNFTPETANFDVVYVSNAVGAPLGLTLAEAFKKPLVLNFLDCPLDPKLTSFTPEITFGDKACFDKFDKEYGNVNFRRVSKTNNPVDPYLEARKKEWAVIKDASKKAVFKTAISSVAAKMVEEHADIPIDRVNWLGADLELVNESPMQLPMRRVGYVGSTRPHKCFEELLFGLTMLEEEPEFHGIIEDMDDYAKWAAMSACMFGATMSVWEGFGLSPVEWAAVKRPCICRAIPVVKEVMEDHAFYVTGPTELAAWSRQLLDHPDYAKKKGQEAYEYIIRKKLTLQDHAQRVADLLQEVLH
jgi:glycosyltransferase involved in cell wall biosynthesis